MYAQNTHRTEAAPLDQLVQGWTLRTWEHDEGQPETREDIPFAHAVAMATRGGFARAQVIDPRTDSIHIES